MRSAHAHAIRSETAVYAPEIAPVPDDALARLERAGPHAVEDHELLGLVGVRVDASILAAAGGLRGLLDDPAAPPRTFPSPARTGPGCTRSSTCTCGGWGRTFAATGRSRAPSRRGATSPRGFARTPSRSSPASSSTTATGSSHSRRSSAAPSTARACIREWSLGGRLRTTRPRSSPATTTQMLRRRERASRLFPNAGARACVRQRGVAGAKRLGGSSRAALQRSSLLFLVIRSGSWLAPLARSQDNTRAFFIDR